MSVRGPDGLIVPRKIPNPCLESNNVRDLHREIKWNAKTGVNVLVKTELERVLDRQRRLRVEREKEEEKAPQTPFSKALAERAKRLEQIALEEEELTAEKNDVPVETVHQRTSIFEPSESNLRPNQSKPVRKTSDPGFLRPPKIDQPTRNRNTQDFCSKLDRSRMEAAKENRVISNRSESCSGGTGHHWEGNSSGSSSKSSSPEPEFFKVFAQMRGSKKPEN